jgi:serine/threonine protein kinase
MKTPTDSNDLPLPDDHIAKLKAMLADSNSLPDTEPSQTTDRSRNIGPYKLLQRIGAGGMGEVWMAEQEKPVRRRVALKLIKAGMDSKPIVARFEAERQALALMDHPHIAKVFDAGCDESGRPFFVMEYVKGKPITQYADENHLNIPERLELFEQVCHAIQHAHHKGIIHRDLKPSNVLVMTQDGIPFAKVIDFGIAKAISQQLTDLTLFTFHDQLIGTPQYMSPEQAAGSVDIDTRTDVYSLGVLLYEILTGSTPFAKEELQAAGLERIKKIIIEDEPPKPSTRLSQSMPTIGTLAASRKTDPKRLGLLIRGELDWIVMKSLDKDRKRRYSTPNELADDVRAHLTGQPIEAAPPSRLYQLQKMARKHRAALVVACAIVGALSLGLLGTTISYFRAERMAENERLARIESNDARDKEAMQREAAEFEAYVANLNLAQNAMQNGQWPEAREFLAACPESQRSWEWRFLSKRAKTFIRELPYSAHPPVVSQDKSKVLIFPTDRSIRLIDLGDVSANFSGKEFEFTSDEVSTRHTFQSVLSLDAKTVLIPYLTESDQVVCLIDCLTGQIVLSKSIEEGFFSNSSSNRIDLQSFEVDSSPDLRFLLIHRHLRSTHFMELWDVAQNRRVTTIEGPRGYSRMLFSPDGSGLLAYFRDSSGGLTCYSTVDGTKEFELVGQGFSFSADSKNVLYTDDGRSLLMIDRNGKEVSRLELEHPYTLNEVDIFSPTKNVLVYVNSELRHQDSSRYSVSGVFRWNLTNAKFPDQPFLRNQSSSRYPNRVLTTDIVPVFEGFLDEVSGVTHAFSVNCISINNLERIPVPIVCSYEACFDSDDDRRLCAVANLGSNDPASEYRSLGLSVFPTPSTSIFDPSGVQMGASFLYTNPAYPCDDTYRKIDFVKNASAVLVNIDNRCLYLLNAEECDDGRDQFASAEAKFVLSERRKEGTTTEQSTNPLRGELSNGRLTAFALGQSTPLYQSSDQSQPIIAWTLGSDGVMFVARSDSIGIINTKRGREIVRIPLVSFRCESRKDQVQRTISKLDYSKESQSLFIQFQDGSLEVWDARSITERRTKWRERGEFLGEAAKRIQPLIEEHVPYTQLKDLVADDATMTLQQKLACCQLLDQERLRLEYDSQFEFDQLTGIYPYDPEKIATAIDTLIDEEKPWRQWRMRGEVKKKLISYNWSRSRLEEYLKEIVQSDDPVRWREASRIWNQHPSALIGSGRPNELTAIIELGLGNLANAERDIEEAENRYKEMTQGVDFVGIRPEEEVFFVLLKVLLAVEKGDPQRAKELFEKLSREAAVEDECERLYDQTRAKLNASSR